MKLAIFFGAIFSTFVFSAATNAQTQPFDKQTRLLVGTDGGIWKSPNAGFLQVKVEGGWVSLPSESAAAPTLPAGKTIRLRIASTNNQGKLIVGVDNVHSAPGGKIYVATEVGVYSVPCSGGAIGAGTGTLTLTGSISDDVLTVQTAKAWSGKCQMLIMKLSDGREVRGVVRFGE